MSHYLSLKDLANELDDLREKDEAYKDWETSTDEEKEGDEPECLDDADKDKLQELIAIEDALGDLHVYSKNYDDCLIHESDFEDYIREQVEETSDFDRGNQWLAQYIDWERLADDSKHDYVEVSYERCEYLIRAN